MHVMYKEMHCADFPGGSGVKRLPVQETWVGSSRPNREDPCYHPFIHSSQVWNLQHSRHYNSLWGNKVRKASHLPTKL